jgi:hypothetical protein
VEAIRAKDHSEVASITEAFSLAMPFMNPVMTAALPEMLMAVLGLVKSLTNEIEKIYAEKEMDDDLTEEMSEETDEVEEVNLFLFSRWSLWKLPSNRLVEWPLSTICASSSPRTTSSIPSDHHIIGRLPCTTLDNSEYHESCCIFFRQCDGHSTRVSRKCRNS